MFCSVVVGLIGHFPLLLVTFSLATRVCDRGMMEEIKMVRLNCYITGVFELNSHEIEFDFFVVDVVVVFLERGERNYEKISVVLNVFDDVVSY